MGSSGGVGTFNYFTNPATEFYDGNIIIHFIMYQ